jgi:glycosyltransferase involved in cell wall biosynthesis
MRIAWFTPFNPRSAIGDYSAAIVNYLAQADDVVTFAAEQDEAPRNFPGTVVRMPADPDEVFLADLDDFDYLVYNLGDCLAYHLPIYEVAQRRPGVVILHDLVMADFFRGYYFRHKRDSEALIRAFRYGHGAAGEQRGQAMFESRREFPPEDPSWLDLTLFRPALRGCQGVVVHSRFALDRVAEVSPAPACHIDFPIFGPAEAFVADRPTVRRKDDRVELLSFGVLNPNKLAHSTIEALAASPLLRSRVRYRVIGKGDAEYTARLTELVRQHRLEDVVHLLGYRSNEELRDALATADVVVNLRNPHLGESSATLLTALVAGVATVVWDHGFYGEFPDDVVWKIRAEDQLRPLLERLAGNAGLRRRSGQKAREHALERFSVERYCSRLRAFLEQTRPVQPYLALADRVSAGLAEMGSGPMDGLAGRLVREIAWFAPQNCAPVRPPTR